jgi:hypothetical protein
MTKLNTSTHLTRSERETYISKTADESTWTIVTNDPVVCKRLTKIYGVGKKLSELYTSWIVGKTCISFRKPK